MRSCIVHSLPVAANFVGRRAELDELGRRLLEPESPVRTVSLVGIGGAGKTALAAEFLRSLPDNPQRPDLLFVWSFYVDQDPNSFLAAAHSFVTEGVAPARAARAGAGALHSLTDALGGLDRRVVLVLDGLERVQIPRDHRRRSEE